MATPISDIFKSYNGIANKGLLTLNKHDLEVLEDNRQYLDDELKNTSFPQPVGEAVVVLHDIVSAKISHVNKLRGGK